MMVPPEEHASKTFHWVRRRQIWTEADIVPEWTTIGVWRDGVWKLATNDNRTTSPGDMSVYGWTYLGPVEEWPAT
jgi:hypothetical protein